jgi:hypothetical protein
MNFSTSEIAVMTAEERSFYLEWFADIKKKENDATSSGQTPTSDGPKLGPAAR